MAITPTVTQVGFSTGSGLLSDIVDGDAGTGWAPNPDRFVSYTAAFTTGVDSVVGAKGGFAGVTVGTPNVGASFPFIQFDYGTAIRIGSFLIQVETDLTLGAACLIGSDNPASDVAQAIQVGDVCMGKYTAAEITGNQVLLTRAVNEDVVKRYYRLLQRSSEA